MTYGLYSAWANRLTDTRERYRMYWEDVPANSRPGVLAELEQRVKDGRLTQAALDEIIAG